LNYGEVKNRSDQSPRCMLSELKPAEGTLKQSTEVIVGQFE
jgi:hypothetical protein